MGGLGHAGSMDRAARRRLADAVTDGAVAEHETEVARLVKAARRAGLDEIWCSVAADRTAPEVARTRALGRIAAELSRQEQACARERLAG